MVRIKTNNHERLVIDGYELSEKERKEFDYLNWDTEPNDEKLGKDGYPKPTKSGYESEFFRYRNQLYDLGEFMSTYRMPEFSPLKKWDGYFGDSYFSGIVVRYCADSDHVIVGTYYE